jgi:hypothetical protein
MTPEMTETWRPEPKIVTPGNILSDGMVTAPSDAIVLFDGSGLSQWEPAPDSESLIPGKDMSKFKSSAGKETNWNVNNGILTINKEAGDLQTKQTFGDFQLYIEWCIPKDIHGKGQFRGNSGVFLQGHYELQILDSYRNKTYVNGQAASIYKQTAPLVNAMRKPGDWNTSSLGVLSFRTSPAFFSQSFFIISRTMASFIFPSKSILNRSLISTKRVGEKGACFVKLLYPRKYWKYMFPCICATTSLSDRFPRCFMITLPRIMRPLIGRQPSLDLKILSYLPTILSHGIAATSPGYA